MDEQLTDSCAQWWADLLEIPDKRDAFKRALLSRVRDDMVLYVDYSPCLILKSALVEAGISPCGNRRFCDMGILPLKTTMRTWDGIVEVSKGYGSPFTSLDNYRPDGRTGLGNLFIGYEQLKGPH